MKKKTLKKLNFKKSVISNLNTQKIKGGGSRACATSIDNCGGATSTGCLPTDGTCIGWDTCGYCTVDCPQN